MSTYLDRLVERATGAVAPVIARAPRPDPGGTLDELETIARAAPVPPTATPGPRSLAHEVRSETTTIIERSLQPIVEHVVSEAPAAYVTPPQEPALQPPRAGTPEREVMIQRGTTPLVERDRERVEVSTSVPPETVVVEQHHQHERVEHAAAPSIVRERVHPVEPAAPQIVETRSVPVSEPPLATPLAMPSLPPPPVAPQAESLPQEPRLVIGRLTVELVQPQQPGPTPPRTIIVQRAAPAPRTDVVLRTFGLDQG